MNKRKVALVTIGVVVLLIGMAVRSWHPKIDALFAVTGVLMIGQGLRASKYK